MKVVVATASVNQTPLAWSANLERIQEAGRGLGRRSCDVLLLPELAISGYGCEDMFASPAVLERAWESTLKLAAFFGTQLPSTAVVVGLPVGVGGQVFNCAAVLYGGQIVGVVPKSRLAGDGVHYEPRWFAAFDESTCATKSIETSTSSLPFGRLVFTLRGFSFAIEICEDAWVADRPALHYAAHGCDLILNPSASHFAFGKHCLRRRIVQESSRSFGIAYVLVNLLGNEAGRMIYDGDSIAASAGEIMAAKRPFSFADHALQTVELDLGRDRVLRARTFSMQSYRSSSRAKLVRQVDLGDPAPVMGFGAPAAVSSEKAGGQNEVPTGLPLDRPGAELPRETEFLRAVALGLFDYWRKARVSGLVVSLSGGADSSACAVLAQRCLMYALSELGAPATVNRLGLPGLAGPLAQAIGADDASGALPLEGARLAKATRFLAGRLIHTIYQSTRNSSTQTRVAARAVAEALGTNHTESDVDSLVQGYVDLTQKAIGRDLSWTNDDLALQNIQARVRSPLAWMLANSTGSLLLTTSNRSEAAVGYCTMDGDTSGGLAPLSGIDKAFLRHWLRYMQTEGDVLGGPIPALKAVNDQAPTAELRPTEAGQTDEADLMPYELLDRIERLAIRDRKSPAEVYLALKPDYPGTDLKVFVRRFFVLWSRNQWKRERYAPSFHLDDENLDPRTWYRFPILSGGYSDELAELDELEE